MQITMHTHEQLHVPVHCTSVNWLVGIVTIHHQCKLQVMTTKSASEVFELVDYRKTSPAQVAGNDQHECKFALVDD